MSENKAKLTFTNFFFGVDAIIAQTDKATLLKVSETKGLWIPNTSISLTKAEGRLSLGIASELEYTVVKMDDKKDKGVSHKGADLIENMPFDKAGERKPITIDIYRKANSSSDEETK